MRKIIILSVLMVLSGFTFSLQAQYVTKGSLLGHDVKPMLRADIFVLSNETRFPRPVLKSFPVNEDGSFKIEFDRPGLYRLNFAGVNHKPFELPVYIDKMDTILIKILLQGIRYKKNIQEIKFLTDYDADANRLAHSIAVQPDKNGVFVSEFKANDDVFEYQIFGIDEDNHSVNGTQADFWIPDRSADYFSAINTSEDSLVTIVFDPYKLTYSNSVPHFEILHAPETTRKFFIIHQDYEKRFQAYGDYVMEGRSRGIYDHDYANNYGWEKDFKELDRMITQESDPFLRKGWILLRLQIALNDAFAKPKAKISKSLAMKALKEIASDSPLWSYHPNTLLAAIGYASEVEKQFADLQQQHTFLKEFGKPFMTYLDSTVATHPDSSINEILLRAAIGQSHKFNDNEAFEKYYDQYLKKYKGTRNFEITESFYSPSIKIKPGAEVPDFSLPSLDNSQKMISKQSLLGTNYVINFWALWCGPCKPGLEALSRIYEKHHHKNFAILSVSMNYNKQDVVDYRKHKLPMPWLHAHLTDWKPGQGILKDFEVVTIPKNVLVNKNGYIVAVNIRNKEFFDKVVELISKN